MCAKVLNRIAGILMRQQLGYEVEYVSSTGTTHMYNQVAGGAVDAAYVMWPANFEAPGQVRYVAVNKEDRLSPTGYSVVSLGLTGYKARSGWYLTAITNVTSTPSLYGSSAALYFPKSV